MYLYEDSLIKDLNRIFTNSKVCAIIADSLDEGLKRIAAMKEDKVVLPLIVLVGGDWSIDDTNFYSLMHGSEFKTTDNNLSKSTSIIPITPSYEMYVIAKSSRECDMLTRELLFYYNTNPTLTVDIPYGIDNIHTFNLIFGSRVRKFSRDGDVGFVYRILDLTLQGVYLWHNNTFNITKEITTKVNKKYEDNIK